MHPQFDERAKVWGKELFTELKFEIFDEEFSDGKTRSKKETPSYQGNSSLGSLLIIPVQLFLSVTPSAETWTKMRRYLWEQSQFGIKKIVLDVRTWRDVSNQAMASFQQRMDDLLQVIMSQTPALGDQIILRFIEQRNSLNNSIEQPTTSGQLAYAASGASSKKEFWFFLDHLAKSKLIRNSGEVVTLQSEGIIYLETKVAQRTLSEQAFVAMWFPDEAKSPDEYQLMDRAYRLAIEPAVRAAGYRPYCVRDDMQTKDLINDRIVAEIRRSRFLIADFSCEKDKPRGGVYFETGFAKGLKLPIIWMARKESEGDLHFDTNHYPHILWNDLEQLRKELKQRIIANIDQGPVPIPPDNPSSEIS